MRKEGARRHRCADPMSAGPMPLPAQGLRRLLAGDKLIVAPGAYDCITARTVEMAGFAACYMTGSGTAASLGYPDYGLVTMSEMAAKRIAVRTSSSPGLASIRTLRRRRIVDIESNGRARGERRRGEAGHVLAIVGRHRELRGVEAAHTDNGPIADDHVQPVVAVRVIGHGGDDPGTHRRVRVRHRGAHH